MPIEPLAALAFRLAVCAMNAPLLRFIGERRGWAFAAAPSLPLIVHFVVCGVGFVLGHLAARHPRFRTPAPECECTEVRPESTVSPARQRQAVRQRQPARQS